MKAAGHTNETENHGGAPVDPFAVDFFGGAATVADDEIETDVRVPRIRRRRGSDWARSLPKLSNEDAGFSYALDGFSTETTVDACRAAASALARLLNFADANCRVVSVVETALAETLRRESSGRVVIELASAMNGAAIIVDTSFAGELVDKLLGGEAETQALRQLTATETAVLEFASAAVVNALNGLGGGAIELRGAGAARAELFQTGQRGAEIVVEVDAGELGGIVSVLATPGFMRSVSAANARRPAASSFAAAERTAREVGLFLQAGTTILDAGSLAFLETDDIVIIDRPRLASADSFDGEHMLFVGRGGNVRLRGTIIDTAGGASFTVGDIISETARRKFTPVKFMMDQFEDERSDGNLAESDSSTEVAESAAEETLAPALENIQVALRVEIAGNRISLRELQDLRPGQIIGLGCGPNDPVRLVTDSSDEPVATGELVEIEGQLGVRLTKVFV